MSGSKVRSNLMRFVSLDIMKVCAEELKVIPTFEGLQSIYDTIKDDLIAENENLESLNKLPMKTYYDKNITASASTFASASKIIDENLADCGIDQDDQDKLEHVIRNYVNNSTIDKASHTITNAGDDEHLIEYVVYDEKGSKKSSNKKSDEDDETINVADSDDEDKSEEEEPPKKSNIKKQQGIKLTNAASIHDDNFDDSGDEEEEEKPKKTTSKGKKQQPSATKVAIRESPKGKSKKAPIVLEDHDSDDEKKKKPTSAAKKTKNDKVERPLVSVGEDLYSIVVTKGAELVNTKTNHEINCKAPPPLNDEYNFEESKETLIGDYGKMFKDSLKIAKDKEAASAKKSSKKTTITATAKDVDDWVKATNAALKAEEKVLEMRFEVTDKSLSKPVQGEASKIDFKKIHKASNIYLMTVHATTKVPGSGKSKSDKTVESSNVYVPKEIAAGKEYKQDIKKINFTAILKKKYNTVEAYTRTFEQTEDKHLIAFYNAYVNLLAATEKIAKLPLQPEVLFNSECYINSPNILSKTISSEIAGLHPVENLIYKKFGLVCGAFTAVDNFEVIEPDYVQYCNLVIGLSQFIKPLTAKMFETVFSNRFYFNKDKKIAKLIDTALRQSLNNIREEVDEEKLPAAKAMMAVWASILGSPVFTRAIRLNYEFSKTFLTIFKKVYSDVESVKLYISALYPISFLFTPFMLGWNDDGEDKIVETFRAITDKNKAKNYTTDFIKTFIHACTNNAQHTDWIYFLNQNNCNEWSHPLCVITVLYSKFDKADKITEDDAQPSKTEDTDDEDNKEE